MSRPKRLLSYLRRLIFIQLLIVVAFSVSPKAVLGITGACAPKLADFGIEKPVEISNTKLELKVYLKIDGLNCTPEQLKQWVLNFKDVHNPSMSYYSDGMPLSTLPADTINTKTGTAEFFRPLNLIQFSALSVLQVFPVLINEGADLTSRIQANSKLCVKVINKNYSMETPNPNCVIPMQLLNVSKGLGEGPSIKSVPDYDKGIGVFQNPLEGGTVSGLIAQAIRIMLVLVGASAVVVIAISGFQLVLSQGNSDKRTSAIRSITWAIAGLILSILSFSVVAILQRIIS